MEIWIKKGKLNIRLPVLPSSYKVTKGSNNTTVNVNAIGEINIVGNQVLEEISFDTFIPATYNPSYCDCQLEYSATEYVKQLRKIKDKGVCKLTISGVFSGDVTMEQFDYSEDDGTGDVKVSFTFKKFKKPTIKKVTKKKGKNGVIITKTKVVSQRGKKSITKLTYKSQEGDSLSKIAMVLTGKTGNWKKIYADNKKKIGTNPNELKAGTVLKLRKEY